MPRLPRWPGLNLSTDLVSVEARLTGYNRTPEHVPLHPHPDRSSPHRFVRAPSGRRPELVFTVLSGAEINELLNSSRGQPGVVGCADQLINVVAKKLLRMFHGKMIGITAYVDR